MISGKDYYRRAGRKERGTCNNTLSVRKEPVETATLSFLQHHLLTEDHARVFAEEFRREMKRLSDGDERRDDGDAIRLQQIKAEIANLTQSLLAGVTSPTIVTMINMREQEKAKLEARHHPSQAASPATLLPSRVVKQRFEEKVGALRTSLDDRAVRGEAARIIATLIKSVTIYPSGEHGPDAEVVARISDLMAYATNGDATLVGGASCSVKLVAGTGFEPVTFRL